MATPSMFFQFHYKFLHGSTTASLSCAYCGKGTAMIYCKVCKKFISQRTFQAHKRVGCSQNGEIPNEKTFRNEFLVALEGLMKGKVVGRMVKEGFVMKGEGGKIYVGDWSLLSLVIREEEELREEGKLDGWVEKAKMGRKRNREIETLGGNLDGVHWETPGGRKRVRMETNEQGIFFFFFFSFSFSFSFLFLFFLPFLVFDSFSFFFFLEAPWKNFML